MIAALAEFAGTGKAPASGANKPLPNRDFTELLEIAAKALLRGNDGKNELLPGDAKKQPARSVTIANAKSDAELCGSDKRPHEGEKRDDAIAPIALASMQGFEGLAGKRGDLQLTGDASALKLCGKECDTAEPKAATTSQTHGETTKSVRPAGSALPRIRPDGRTNDHSPSDEQISSADESNRSREIEKTAHEKASRADSRTNLRHEVASRDGTSAKHDSKPANGNSPAAEPSARRIRVDAADVKPPFNRPVESHAEAVKVETASTRGDDGGGLFRTNDGAIDKGAFVLASGRTEHGSAILRHEVAGGETGYIARPAEIIEGLKERLVLMARAKKDRAVVRLHPPELGKIEIRLELAGRECRAEILVQNPQVKSLIESKAAELAQGLQSADIDLSELNVSLGNGSGNEPAHDFENPEATFTTHDAVPKRIRSGARRGAARLTRGILDVVV